MIHISSAQNAPEALLVGVALLVPGIVSSAWMRAKDRRGEYIDVRLVGLLVLVIGTGAFALLLGIGIATGVVSTDHNR